MAAQRGYEVVAEFTDNISGTKAKRLGLDQMMADGRRGRIDVVLVWASDRIARSTRHFLEVLDELNLLGVEFISFREQINIDGPLGGPSRSPIGAVAELERNLIIESLARRYAARQAQGLPHRPQSARTGPCRNLARPLPRPEPSPDR